MILDYIGFALVLSVTCILVFFYFFTTFDLKVLCHLLNELSCRTAFSSYDKNAKSIYLAMTICPQ